jgi:flagellar motor switch protein FliG
MVRKPADLVPLMLRLPEDLRRRIEREATRNQRSLNAEVVRRLEDSFRSEDSAQLIDKTAKATAAATAADIFAKLESGELKGPQIGTHQRKK